MRVLGWRGVVSRFRNAICRALGMQFFMLQEFNLSHFRNAICHTLGMQLKYIVYKKLCTLTQVYRSQRYSGASGLIVATTKW